MNFIQEAIASITGFDSVRDGLQADLEIARETSQEQQAELIERIQRTENQNGLLQRQIEDLDYLNLFDIGAVTEVIPSVNRKNTINRLRRLRQENPIAKQAIKLIVRFTLGKGVELVVGPDPEQKMERPPLQIDGGAPDDDEHKTNGLFPGNKKDQPFPPLKRPRPQVSEAISNLPPPVDPNVISDMEEDALKEQIQAFWKDSDNQRALTSRASMQKWVDETATDGEKFFIGFEGDAAPYLKLTKIPLEEIDTIIYDPDNWEKPVYYVRVYNETEWDGDAKAYVPKKGANNPVTRYYLDYRIDAEEVADLRTRIKLKEAEVAPIEQRILHTYINPLWTKKGCRGISELYSSREWFRVYKEFMEDRAAINAAATAIAYQRKIKGGPTAVAGFQGKLGPLEVGIAPGDNTADLRKLTRPAGAGIYDSNPAMDLEWMKADTGAVNAKEDGRSILTAGGAGVGIYVHYFGDGGDANLATAQAMELPMVKTFEDWQQWVEDTLREFCSWVIRVATDQENAAKQIDRVAGNFPPIISQDVVKYMTAWSQLVQNVAPGNRVVHEEAIKGALTVMNVPNVDSKMREIAAEEVQLQAQREAQRQAMLDSLQNGGFADPTNGNGNGGTKPARDGSGQGLPGDMKTIVKGKPQPERNGPKPAR